MEIENSRFNESYVYENVLKFDESISNELKRLFVRNIFKKLIYNPFEDMLEVEFL